MGGPRSTASREEILAAFDTEETFKGVCARIGMSPNTLRGIWKDAFGEEAFVARGKKLQAEAASATCKATALTRVYKDVHVPCSKCKTHVSMKGNQAAQINKSEFLCDECKDFRFDRTCPVCGLLVDGERGLSGHIRHRREANDEDHLAYLVDQAASRWQGKTEDLDYVRCRVCGHWAETLARHLKAAHGISAETYRFKYGPNVRIRSLRLEEARSLAAKNRDGGFGKGGQKVVACPSCGNQWEGSKFLVPGTHDLRCDKCRGLGDAIDETLRWLDKSEPEDYVTCLECFYRAENLTSHIQNVHPGYRDSHPGALLVALRSAIRDKEFLRGIVRPPEFGQKIREAKLIGFTRDDFSPFMEPDGTVDQRAMLKSVGCAWVTLKSYMDDLGLKPTRKYIDEAAKARRVVLTPEMMKLYRLNNGKISIAKAVLGTGFCNITIKKECDRLKFKWAHDNISQAKCLRALSEALEGLLFHTEWSEKRFTNVETGRRFRFDGYFPDVGLVVEFQGHQHYRFPNAFMIDESYLPVYEALRERDRIKRELINASPDLLYLEILEDEPYTDVSYLRGRLAALGIHR